MICKSRDIMVAIALVLAACSSTPPPMDLTLTATDIAYDTSEFSAKINQKININFVNEGVLEHNFIIDEFGVDNLLKSGEHVAIFFTPQQPGSYEFYCNVAGHLEAGMKGTLRVTE